MKSLTCMHYASLCISLSGWSWQNIATGPQEHPPPTQCCTRSISRYVQDIVFRQTVCSDGWRRAPQTKQWEEGPAPALRGWRKAAFAECTDTTSTLCALQLNGGALLSSALKQSAKHCAHDNSRCTELPRSSYLVRLVPIIGVRTRPQTPQTRPGLNALVPTSAREFTQIHADVQQAAG